MAYFVKTNVCKACVKKSICWVEGNFHIFIVHNSILLKFLQQASFLFKNKKLKKNLTEKKEKQTKWTLFRENMQIAIYQKFLMCILTSFREKQTKATTKCYFWHI